MGWKDVKFWDWETIVKTSLFLILTGSVFFFLANQGHFSLEFAQRNMQLKTYGYIINKHNLSGNNNTLTGTRPVINGLQINYTYFVNGVAYNKVQILKYSVIDAPKLNYINKSPPPIKVMIIYNQKKPSESSVAL